jgi:hypothetical protein
MADGYISNNISQTRETQVARSGDCERMQKVKRPSGREHIHLNPSPGYVIDPSQRIPRLEVWRDCSALLAASSSKLQIAPTT